MALKVIGAGFGRTGTNSMRLALEMLGLGPCHHMFVLIQDPSQQALWDTYPKGATPDWDQAFSGFQSAVDWPSTYYWQDIARHYPDANVLLTLRSAESWWASFSNTVLNHITSLKGSGSWVDNIITQTIMQGHPDDRDTAIAAFNANNAQVRALVPRERLVVHELGDGWGPLCDAFGLPTPAEPYPVTNSTADFQAFHAARNATAEAATQKTT